MVWLLGLAESVGLLWRSFWRKLYLVLPVWGQSSEERKQGPDWGQSWYSWYRNPGSEQRGQSSGWFLQAPLVPRLMPEG